MSPTLEDMSTAEILEFGEVLAMRIQENRENLSAWIAYCGVNMELLRRSNLKVEILESGTGYERQTVH